MYHCKKYKVGEVEGTKATEDLLRREDDVASDEWGNLRRKKIKRGMHESAKRKEFFREQLGESNHWKAKPSGDLLKVFACVVVFCKEGLFLILIVNVG